MDNVNCQCGKVLGIDTITPVSDEITGMKRFICNACTNFIPNNIVEQVTQDKQEFQVYAQFIIRRIKNNSIQEGRVIRLCLTGKLNEQESIIKAAQFIQRFQEVMQIVPVNELEEKEVTDLLSVII